MPKLGTEEWFEEFAEILKEDSDYQEAAQDWEKSNLFRIIGEEGYLVGEGEEVNFYIDVYHGEVREYGFYSSPEEAGADFVYTVKISVLEDLASGDKDAIQALLKGEYKLEGDRGYLMQHTETAQEFTNCLTKVPTE